MNQPEASCCGACGNARPRPAALQTPAATIVARAASAQPAGPPGLLGWLRAHRLEEYHGALVEQGFEEVQDLRDATQREVDQIFDLVGMKPGHMLRFRRALRTGAGEAR